MLDRCTTTRSRLQLLTDGLRTYAGHLVTAAVVEDNDVSRLERWAQEFDPLGKKHRTVDGPVGDHGRGQATAAQSAHKGSRLPMPVRCRSGATLASGGTPIAPRHVGRCPS